MAAQQLELALLVSMLDREVLVCYSRGLTGVHLRAMRLRPCRYGPDRALYLPGGLLDRDEVPAYLNGSLPGDYGYDPLGLGKDGGVDKYRVNEVLHARWAMLVSSCPLPCGQYLAALRSQPVLAEGQEGSMKI